MNIYAGWLAMMAFVPLSGCTGGDMGQDLAAPAQQESPLPLALSAIGEKSLATAPGHRVNEYWLASDPSDPHVVAAAVMDGDDPAGGSICTVVLSEDGGMSWRDITPPQFHTVLGQADPWITIDAQGAIHVACMEWNGNSTNGDTQMWYTRSSDRGQMWSNSMPMPGDDREIIFAGKDDVLYWCARTQGQAEIFASHDGGHVWGMVGAPDTGGSNCHSLSQGPDGSLYLATGGRVLRSPDGGVSWIEPQSRFQRDMYDDEQCRVVDEHAPQGRLWCTTAMAFVPVPRAIWMHAVDPTTGDVFVAFQNLTQQEGLTGRLYHVELHRSQDLGLTFQKVDVPPAADRCEGCHSSRPLVHVDDEGRIGLLWHQGETSLWWQTWFAASGDGGRTWSDPILLSETAPEDSPAGPGNVVPYEAGSVVNPVTEWLSDPDVSYPGAWRLLGGATETTWGHRYEGGDYATMSSTPEGFLPCWTDLDGGVPQLWCQPVRVGVVA